MLHRNNYNITNNPYREASINLDNLFIKSVSSLGIIGYKRDIIISDRNGNKAGDSLITDDNNNSNKDTVFNTNIKDNTTLLPTSSSNDSLLLNNVEPIKLYLI